jgi:hypothetical protein
VQAQRLEKILNKIINEDQTGYRYIKYRYIGFNLRQIRDTIYYANIHKIEDQ